MVLREHGVIGVEVAPTRIWPEWRGATPEAAAAYRAQLANEGFVIPSMQAVLFGKPEAMLFDTAGRSRFIGHLRTVAGLAHALGAGTVVLGAPRQRDRGALSSQEAFEQAVTVFAELGQVFSEHGACLCIEPNPRRYGCNFIVNALEAVALVRAVASPGFGLHLDAAAMHIECDRLGELWGPVSSLLRHYHMSEPDLGDFSNPVIDHEENIRILDAGGYRGWISLELREPADGVAGLARAIRCAQRAGRQA